MCGWDLVLLSPVAPVPLIGDTIPHHARCWQVNFLWGFSQSYRINTVRNQMNNQVEEKATFIYFGHNPELITPRYFTWKGCSTFRVRLARSRLGVGASALQPISTMLVALKHLMFSPFHSSGRGWRARLELGLHLLFGSTIWGIICTTVHYNQSSLL